MRLQKKLIFVTALIGTTIGSSVVNSQPLGIYEYAVKFVCGVVGQSSVLARGVYFTAINVHNQSNESVELRKRIAIALPSERAGKVSEFFTASLKPDEALEIDCPDILRHVGSEQQRLVKGFVVIQSKVELDVVGVYTAAPSIAGTVIALEIDRIPARKK